MLISIVDIADTQIFTIHDSSYIIKNPAEIRQDFFLVDLIGFEPTTPTMRM